MKSGTELIITRDGAELHVVDPSGRTHVSELGWCDTVRGFEAFAAHIGIRCSVCYVPPGGLDSYPGLPGPSL